MLHNLIAKAMHAMQEPHELDIFVDPVTYTEQQLSALLSQLHSGNSRHGGVRLVLLVCSLLTTFSAQLR